MTKISARNSIIQWLWDHLPIGLKSIKEESEIKPKRNFCNAHQDQSNGNRLKRLDSWRYSFVSCRLDNVYSQRVTFRSTRRNRLWSYLRDLLNVRSRILVTYQSFLLHYIFWADFYILSKIYWFKRKKSYFYERQCKIYLYDCYL